MEMKVWYDMLGTVHIDTLKSPGGFPSQFFPDGHLMVTFPNKDGVIIPPTGDPITGVTQIRYAKAHRTVLTSDVTGPAELS